MKKLITLILTFLTINVFAVTREQIDKQVKIDGVEIEKMLENDAENNGKTNIYNLRASNFNSADMLIEKFSEANQKTDILLLAYPNIKILEKYNNKLPELAKIVIIVLLQDKNSNEFLKNRSLEELAETDFKIKRNIKILIVDEGIEQELEDYVNNKESKIMNKIVNSFKSGK